MKKLNKALFLLMLLLSACVKNAELVPGGHISAVMESEQTKTSVTDEGSFTWSAGDKVWIGTTSGGVVGTLSDGAGTSKAEFTYDTFFGEMTGKAVYPYNVGHVIKDNELSMVLPASYDLGLTLSNTNALMYGVNVDGTVQFSHLAGVMRFKFKNVPAGTDKFQITLDKKVNGTFLVDLDSEQPIVEAGIAAEKADKVITLNFAPLQTVSDIVLYVPLPVGTYTSIGLDLWAGDQSVWTYSNTVTNTINRKTLKLMPTITLGGTVGGDIAGGDSEDPDDQVNGNGGIEYPFSQYGYLGPNGVLMDTYGDNVYYTTDYIDVTKASSIYYHGRMGPVSNYYSIAFYDADKKFIPSLSICGTGNIETYYITLTDKYRDAVYVRGSWARGPNLDITATYDFVFIIDGKPAEKDEPKKRFAVLCDSIGTHGNEGEYCNVVEVVIGPDDVGVELNAYLTYYDVHDAGDRGKPTGTAKEFVIGGQVYTEDDNGKLITFIPTAEDIGKKVGRVYDYNGNSMKTWWLWFAEAYNMEPIPVCWSSSSISSHETTVPRLVNSYAWHDSQIRKCGVRKSGSNDRIAPDYIIIARGTNDWSHSKGTIITEGYFDNPSTWTYPTTDVVGTYYGIKEAVSLTVKKMRTAYPRAKIFLCTMPFNNRGGDFPGIYGGKTWISFNNAIRECAEFFGCGLIDFAACGLTQESLSIYTSDGTHLNAAGHKLAGEKAIADFASQETTLYW